ADRPADRMALPRAAPMVGAGRPVVESRRHPDPAERGAARAALCAHALPAHRHRPAADLDRAPAVDLAAGLPGALGLGTPRAEHPAAPPPRPVTSTRLRLPGRLGPVHAVARVPPGALL